MAQTYYCPQCKRPIRPDQSMCDLCAQQAQQARPPAAAPVYGHPPVTSPSGGGFTAPERTVLLVTVLVQIVGYALMTSPSVLHGAGFFTVWILTALILLSGVFFIVYLFHTVLVRLNAMVSRESYEE